MAFSTAQRSMLKKIRDYFGIDARDDNTNLSEIVSCLYDMNKQDRMLVLKEFPYKDFKDVWLWIDEVNNAMSKIINKSNTQNDYPEKDNPNYRMHDDEKLSQEEIDNLVKKYVQDEDEHDLSQEQIDILVQKLVKETDERDLSQDQIDLLVKKYVADAHERLIDSADIRQSTTHDEKSNNFISVNIKEDTYKSICDAASRYDQKINPFITAILHWASKNIDENIHEIMETHIYLKQKEL